MAAIQSGVPWTSEDVDDNTTALAAANAAMEAGAVLTPEELDALASDVEVAAAVAALLVDEDNMASNLATKAPSQQSTKAYVDAAVAGAGGGATYKRTRLKHSSNLTTTSTSYVDIDGTLLPALSLTLAVGDEVELLLYIGSLNITTAGNVISFDWLIDRPTSADTTVRALESCDAAGVYIGAGFDSSKFAKTFRYQFVCTEAGVHTFKPQWKVSGATGTIVFSDANYDAPLLHRVTNLGAPAA